MTVRRQARGEKRIGEILDAALDLFAETGYERTSTNAIAARAGISPGSLYQYFANKEAIAEALSARLLNRLREAHAAAFDDAAAVTLPLTEAVSLVLDPLIAFNVANPGAKALFGSTAAPAALTAGSRPLHEAVVGRAAALVRARVPGLSDEEVARTALVAVRVVGSMMGPIVEARGAERERLTDELKRVLVGYLSVR